MIFDLLKGAMKGCAPQIINWDEPTIRKRPDGTLVKGRPTRGFGNGTFTYAGKQYNPEPWTDEIMKIKLMAEDIVYADFNRDVDFTFCLAGLYPEGRDGIPHHSDTVPTLDDIVFSISFGAPRVFQNHVYETNIKSESNTSDTVNLWVHERQSYDYLMEDGDVIVFDGHSQMNSTHAVPSVIGVGERINLTFRTGI